MLYATDRLHQFYGHIVMDFWIFLHEMIRW